MKRTDITALFPEATKEQIDALMDINGADINGLRQSLADAQQSLTSTQSELETLRQSGTVEDLQKANDRAARLQQELDDLKGANAIRDIKDKVSAETGIPVNLLSGSTEEECRAMAEAIKAYAKPAAYPRVKDGGDPQTHGKKTTGEQFAEWFKEKMNN